MDLERQWFAGAEGGVDTTAYNPRHAWRLSFFEHYSRRLSAAAVLGDAAVLLGGATTFIAAAEPVARAAEEAMVVAAPVPDVACVSTFPALPSAAQRA